MARSIDSPECKHGWALMNPNPCPACQLEETLTKPSDQSDIVELLEELLEDARRGEIKELAYAAIGSNKAYQHGITTCSDVGRMLGAIAILQSYLARIAENNTTDDN